ncbi:MAG: hypothetical protein OEY00_03695 [Gammaproteobacteria bacterium]|nr:hypothetical protein [Gammaproteobacteria bacterium]
MKNSNLESYINIDNLDRLSCGFQNVGEFVSTADDIYSEPEIIVIKNEQGRMVFNQMVKLFDYKEKGAIALGDDISFPYYVITCDHITAGCRFGVWRYAGNIDSLSESIDTKHMTSDFDNFKEMLVDLFTKRGL